jgi:SAM-dependent methyltransferase
VQDLGWNKTLWDESYDWAAAGEEWSAAWGGSEAQWFGSLYPRLHRVVPAKRILEIAPGFGRWTKFLVVACESYVGIDLSSKCVTACQSTFVAAAHATFINNDGISLEGADGLFDFVFSFDSLVHAEIEVFEHYIPQIISKLAPSGVAFIHHSNLGALSDHESNPHSRANSVGAANVAALIKQHGGRTLIQEVINWGGLALCDCLTMFARADSPVVGPASSMVTNSRFMDEAAIISESQSPYAGVRR